MGCNIFLMMVCTMVHAFVVAQSEPQASLLLSSAAKQGITFTGLYHDDGIVMLFGRLPCGALGALECAFNFDTTNGHFSGVVEHSTNGKVSHVEIPSVAARIYYYVLKKQLTRCHHKTTSQSTNRLQPLVEEHPTDY